MSNDRGQYGKNGVPPGMPPVYISGGGSSIAAWVLGAVAVGGAFLYARHQSKQLEQLYKAGGLPYQSFTGSLREDIRSLPTRAREAYRGFTTRARPSKAAVEPVPVTEQLAPAHSVRARR